MAGSLIDSMSDMVFDLDKHRGHYQEALHEISRPRSPVARPPSSRPSPRNRRPT